MIGALRHRKDILNIIHACEKKYLLSKMCMVEIGEVEDSKNRMQSHSMVGVSKSNFAEECNMLFKDDIIINGVKLENKYKKKRIWKTLKKNLLSIG